MMNKVKLFFIGMLALFLVLIPLLDASEAEQAKPKVEVVKIGEIADYSGPTRAICAHQRAGQDMAAEEINAAGGIKSLGGAKLEIIHLDHEFKSELGKEHANRLLHRDKVSVIILGIPSGMGVMVGRLAENAGTPFYPSMVVTPAKTQQGFKTVFSMVANSHQIAYFGLKLMNAISSEYLARKPTEIGFLYADTEYNNTVHEGMLKYMPQFGYKFVADVTYPFPPKDPTSFILKVKAANPEMVFVSPAGGEAPLIDKTMYTLGYDPFRFGMTSSYIDYAYLASMGTRAENSFGHGMFIEGLTKDATEFADRFRAKFGYPPDQFSGMGYQMIRVIAHAIEQAGSADRAAIVEASRKMNYTKDTGPLVVPYDRITFDETGQIPTKDAGMVAFQVQDGKFVPIWPKMPGTTFRLKDSWKKWQ
jgi:branched-chain amino acid transport system substrate-binding protein